MLHTIYFWYCITLRCLTYNFGIDVLSYIDNSTKYLNKIYKKDNNCFSNYNYYTKILPIANSINDK